MANDLNKVQLIGRLGKDPECRVFDSGDMVANFSVATSERWKDKSGQKQERTEWHNISVFGKLAEVCEKYLKKGSQVYIEGRLQTRKWQDQNGNDRYTTEVVINGFNGSMQMLGSKSEQSQPASNQQPQSHQQQNQSKIPDDYIPF